MEARHEAHPPQQLEAHLWGAANILRGKTAGQDYKNYIPSLMFYKRLCDRWECEAQGRRTGALSQLLRHPARDPGRGHAGGALHTGQGAVQGGRGAAERRVRADVRGDGAGGRGGEGLHPAPARAVERAGPPSQRS
ncbi:MAG: type I restriction-modification system subunit M N-terminal domain-containing protein [Deltaproteobacteria bacterium]|nr:type I restriction-modification system subunit M N-terminal domain-containing protein [Deltaproteobacteria bacterium]